MPDNRFTRNLNSYHYSFEPTGNDAIDTILEAIARNRSALIAATPHPSAEEVFNVNLCGEYLRAESAAQAPQHEHATWCSGSHIVFADGIRTCLDTEMRSEAELKASLAPQAPQQQRFTEVLTPEFVHRLTDEIFATQKPSIEWQYADADKIARTVCDLLAEAETEVKHVFCLGCDGITKHVDGCGNGIASEGVTE